MTTAFPIPATRKTFVRVRSLGRRVEVEVMEYAYLDDQAVAVVRSIDEIQPMPFFRPGTIYPTDIAAVPTASVIVTLEEGTGPVIPLPLAEETDAEHQLDVDCIRYAGAPHAG